MSRTKHAAEIRLPYETRVRLLGHEPLEPGEASRDIRIRAPKEAIDALLVMTPKQRGDVLKLGLSWKSRIRVSDEVWTRFSALSASERGEVLRLGLKVVKGE
jgi:hypothetical protein